MIIYYNQANITSVKIIGYKHATYPNDFKHLMSTDSLQVEIIEPLDFYNTPIGEFENTAFLIGVLKNLTEKYNLHNYIKLHNLNKCSFVHDSTSISADVEILPGAFVGQFCVLSYKCVVGEDSAVAPYSLISHGTKLGTGVNVCPGTIINGTVTVGDYTYIGSRTTIKDGISIAKNTFIGMSSTVHKTIDITGTYIGTPVRKLNDSTVFDHFNFVDNCLIPSTIPFSNCSPDNFLNSD